MYVWEIKNKQTNNVCMYVCMYVCIYVCMHACMHVCMHVCMYAPPITDVRACTDASSDQEIPLTKIMNTDTISVINVPLNRFM